MTVPAGNECGRTGEYYKQVGKLFVDLDFSISAAERKHHPVLGKLAECFASFTITRARQFAKVSAAHKQNWRYPMVGSGGSAF